MAGKTITIDGVKYQKVEEKKPPVKKVPPKSPPKTATKKAPPKTAKGGKK